MGREADENLLSHDAVKLLKSQDAGYLRVALGRGRKEMRNVEEEVGLDAAGKGGAKRVVFDGSAQTESRGKTSSDTGDLMGDNDVNRVIAIAMPETDDTEVEVVDVPENLPPTPRVKSTKALAAQKEAAVRLKAERKKRRRLQEMRVAKLEMLKKRQKEIVAAVTQLELQRAKMARTVGGVNKNGVKFKTRERKR